MSLIVSFYVTYSGTNVINSDILQTYCSKICKPTPTKGGNMFGEMQVTKLFGLSKLEIG